jgi:hypothetical protein
MWHIWGGGDAYRVFKGNLREFRWDDNIKKNYEVGAWTQFV